MNLNKYEEEDFYAYKYSLKIKKNQTPETIASFLKIWLVFCLGVIVYLYLELSNGYGEPISWIIFAWLIVSVPLSLLFTIKKIYQRFQATQAILFSQSLFLFGSSFVILFKNLLISSPENIPLSETGFRPYFIFYNIYIYLCILLVLLGSYLYFKNSLKSGAFRKENVEANEKKSKVKYMAPSLITIISGGFVISMSKIDLIWGNHVLISAIAIPTFMLFIFAAPGPLIISYCKKRFPDFIINYSHE
ncbi:hypothetical protein ACWOFR_08630 [Carnobacterium gallinarum]|uniref:hypothetical protein n=1 Tax=Carnobacterium gallinarum TaxID=2749 RepID=UPI00054ED286|nr:hypothetical protein [Carnobacterium gallinarum]